MPTTAAWRRVAGYVREARIAARYPTYDGFARVVHLSPSTLGNIENARRTGYSAATKQSIEDGLGWRHGSIDKILEGGQPSPLRDPYMQRILAVWDDLQEQTKKFIVSAVEASLNGPHTAPGDEG